MSATGSRQGYVHGTAVVVGETGILIRGESGSGKSALALALMEAATQQGLFTRLVGDDRVQLTASADRLMVKGHPAIAGLIEERGTGILPVRHEPAAIVRCVVDFAGNEGFRGQTRLPETGDWRVCIEGIDLPRMMLSAGMPIPEAARRILAYLTSKWAK